VPSDYFWRKAEAILAGLSDPGYSGNRLMPARSKRERKTFLGFEELAGDFAGGQRMAGVVGVDLHYGFGDLVGNQTGFTGLTGCKNLVPLRVS
jgi:hypothetical protein